MDILGQITFQFSPVDDFFVYWCPSLPAQCSFIISLVWVVCSYLCHIHPLNTSWCLFQNSSQYLSWQAFHAVPIYHGGVSPVTYFHDCSNWGSLAGNIGSSSYPGWPPEALMLARSKFLLANWQLYHCNCHCQANLSGYKELLTLVLPVFQDHHTCRKTLVL